jgi:hypothetical protein
MINENWIAFKMSYDDTLVFPADHLEAFTKILSNARILRKGYSDKAPIAAPDIPGFGFVTHEHVMGCIARARLMEQEVENGS